MSVRVNSSQAELLASLSEDERTEALAGLSDRQLEALNWDWKFWGRPDQLTPAGDWLTWLILAGRGWGKTRTGAEWVREQVLAGTAERIALIGETQRDLEDVMVFGQSGLVSVFPEHQKPKVTRKPVRIEFHNGAVALGYNATEPDQLRGPQFDAAWGDELAKWRYARETFDMLQFGLRLGSRPRQLFTTTPRPISLVKEILADRRTIATRGRMTDNLLNLAESFVETIVDKYGGTRLGRQELDAEILDDVPGALWTRAMIDDARKPVNVPDMQRVVVSIDPSGTAGEEDDGDSIGIIVAGKGTDGRGYILADRSCKLSPDGWGRRAVDAYHEFKADRIIAERNFGGAMVEHVIRTIDKKVSYEEVVASRGKVIRAEPVAALYEQKKISHVGRKSTIADPDDTGDFIELEDQMCAMTRDGYALEGSPDRLDAAVWALDYLSFTARAPLVISDEVLAKSAVPVRRRKPL